MMRSKTKYAILVLLSICAPALAQEVSETTAGPCYKMPAWKTKTLERLQSTRLSVKWEDVPFGDVLKFIAKKTDFRTTSPDVLKDIPVTLELFGMPLETALKYACVQAGAQFKLTKQGIVIGTPDSKEMAPKAEPWSYDVRAILAVRKGKGTSLRPEDLVAFIKTHVDKDSWKIKENTATWKQPGFLHITQTLKIHHEITLLLETLRGNRRQTFFRDEVWIRRLKRKLSETTLSVKWEGVPFKDIVTFIRNKLAETIIVNPETDTDDSPIHLHLMNMPAGVALKYACEQASVDYAFKDRSLFVTTPEEAARIRGQVPAWTPYAPEIMNMALAQGAVSERIDQSMDSLLLSLAYDSTYGQDKTILIIRHIVTRHPRLMATVKEKLNITKIAAVKKHLQDLLVATAYYPSAYDYMIKHKLHTDVAYLLQLKKMGFPLNLPPAK